MIEYLKLIIICDKTNSTKDPPAVIVMIAANCPAEVTQVAEIKAAKDKLMESAQKLFTKMYEQAGAAGGPNPGAGAGPNPGAGAGPAPDGFQGDDVVDGDYKEV